MIRPACGPSVRSSGNAGRSRRCRNSCRRSLAARCRAVCPGPLRNQDLVGTPGRETVGHDRAGRASANNDIVIHGHSLMFDRTLACLRSNVSERVFPAGGLWALRNTHGPLDARKQLSGGRSSLTSALSPELNTGFSQLIDIGEISEKFATAGRRRFVDGARVVQAPAVTRCGCSGIVQRSVWQRRYALASCDRGGASWLWVYGIGLFRLDAPGIAAEETRAVSARRVWPKFVPGRSPNSSMLVVH